MKAQRALSLLFPQGGSQKDARYAYIAGGGFYLIYNELLAEMKTDWSILALYVGTIESH